ncbi:hypothetical protein BDY19DRAFT_440510 [Irpex rosettiformis]|uniref:Uncharacterized protein n=1 Tax=Irpex rosettiformis TaxID=378272 RepID=A0ACB8TUB6_9APHY|nr:hypothetical protein BDY19DRAFT_440510 [Irpex rosettiformis]
MSALVNDLFKLARCAGRFRVQQTILLVSLSLAFLVIRTIKLGILMQLQGFLDCAAKNIACDMEFAASLMRDSDAKLMASLNCPIHVFGIDIAIKLCTLRSRTENSIIRLLCPQASDLRDESMIPET